MGKLAWSLSVVAWLGAVAVGIAAEPKETAGKQVEIQVVIADLAAKDRSVGDGQAVVPGGLVQSSPAKDQVSTLIVVTARTIGPDARRAADNPQRRLQVYPLTNSRARSVLDVLKAVFDDKVAQLTVDERTNSLIAYSTDEELSKIGAILTVLDAKSP